MKRLASSNNRPLARNFWFCGCLSMGVIFFQESVFSMENSFMGLQIYKKENYEIKQILNTYDRGPLFLHILKKQTICSEEQVVTWSDSKAPLVSEEIEEVIEHNKACFLKACKKGDRLEISLFGKNLKDPGNCFYKIFFIQE